MVATFIDEYKALDIPVWQLSYQENFENIQSPDSIKFQEALFEDLRLQLTNLDEKQLAEQQQLEWKFLEYFLALNQERIALEKEWQNGTEHTITDKGIVKMPNGKAWYEYYLKRWLDITVEVDSLYQFGLREIDEAKAGIEYIQKLSEKDSLTFHQFLEDDVFFLNHPDSVNYHIDAFEQYLKPLLPNYFPNIHRVPAIKIKKGSDKRLAQVPGYYRDNTFYYNLFEEPFNKRQIAFLYMHEALPGHHYEVSHRDHTFQMPFNDIYRNFGYGEGWAAYIEELGHELNFYPTIYDALGQIEWDLIRSVRVVLDIGINYFNWSDQEAMDFWRRHIKNQDKTAIREIERIRRWPCQVITYKYGANQFLKWKSILHEDGKMGLKSFHSIVLENGPLPFSVLEKRIINTDPKDFISDSDSINGRFNVDKDLLLPQFDCKTDVDDLHSVAAFVTLMSAPQFQNINYHAVAGTYGIQEGLYVPPNDLFQLAFGEKWSDAHSDFSAALQEVKLIALNTINKGGDIWIAEAGQSDFSAALVKAIRAEMTDLDTKERIHVVQHSDWNEEVTSAESLEYVKMYADYHKIPDGNAVGNGTPGFRTPGFTKWKTMIKDPSLKDIWQLAVELGNQYNGKEGRYNNQAVTENGLDFSDLSETCFILGIEDIKDTEEFFERYAK